MKKQPVLSRIPSFNINLSSFREESQNQSFDIEVTWSRNRVSVKMFLPRGHTFLSFSGVICRSCLFNSAKNDILKIGVQHYKKAAASK